MSTELTLLPRVSYAGREIAGPRLRGLLALLAGDLSSGCSIGRLEEGLWPDERPAHPGKALQLLVFRLRSQLGSEVLVSTPSGYRLALDAEQVDTSAIALHASACARHAAAGEDAEALSQAEAGIALWQGTTLADVAALGDPLAELRAARAPTHAALVRERALALARLGRHAEAVEPLTDLVADHPRDEEALLELLRSQAATSGPADALDRYEAYRRSLRDDLGADPGPALRTLHQRLLRDDAPIVRHGVAHEPNPLLGREDDVATVSRLTRSARVTSIVGAGGLGKTRLAQTVGRGASQRSVYFVELAGVSTDADVAAEVASALGGTGSRQPGHPDVARDARTAVVALLGSAPALLVLDNCEHLLGSVAEFVQALVSMTSELHVLTTSRAPLGLSSESVYALPELSLPSTVELFSTRARAARSGVELPAAQVEELCGQLDGLPLAVELAAARVRVMSVGEIARGLSDRFGLLRGGPRDAPERHRTLRSVVDWSWNLLDPAGQSALAALSVFPGGFVAGAASQVLGRDADDSDVLVLLEELVNQSLLRVADSPSGTRFRMLETVREFAGDRLELSGESGPTCERFLHWSRELGMTHHELAFGLDPFGVASRIRPEQDNLVHAYRLASDRDDDATVTSVCAVLAAMWTVDSSNDRLAGLSEEVAVRLSHFHPQPDAVDVTRSAAALLATTALLMQSRGSLRWLVVLRRLPPAPPDTVARAAAIVLLALPGDRPANGSDERPTLDDLCDSDDPLLAGMANGFTSYVREHRSDVEGSLEAAEGMLDAFEDRPEPLLRVLAHSRLGELCLLAGRGERAAIELRAAIGVLEEYGYRADVFQIRWALVLADVQRGALSEAERSLDLAAGDETEGIPDGVTFALSVRAEIALARGRHEEGLSLWRDAVACSRSVEFELYRVESVGLDPWALEMRAVAVVAHARHGRTDLVEPIIEALPDQLVLLLTRPPDEPAAYYVGDPISGVLLLAVAMIDLDRARRDGDPDAASSGARLVALAQRFGYVRQFQPTMSETLAREAAQDADRPAYDDAVSSYAGLGREELLGVALATLSERDRG